MLDISKLDPLHTVRLSDLLDYDASVYTVFSSRVLCDYSEKLIRVQDYTFVIQPDIQENLRQFLFRFRQTSVREASYIISTLAHRIKLIYLGKSIYSLEDINPCTADIACTAYLYGERYFVSNSMLYAFVDNLFCPSSDVKKDIKYLKFSRVDPDVRDAKLYTLYRTIWCRYVCRVTDM